MPAEHFQARDTNRLIFPHRRYSEEPEAADPLDALDVPLPELALDDELPETEPEPPEPDAFSKSSNVTALLPAVSTPPETPMPA